jgi:hypothetical protein
MPKMLEGGGTERYGCTAILILVISDVPANVPVPLTGTVAVSRRSCPHDHDLVSPPYHTDPDNDVAPRGPHQEGPQTAYPRSADFSL